MRNEVLTNRRGFISFLFSLTIAVTLAACSTNSSSNDDGDNNEPPPPPATTADVVITVDNVGASAWEFTDVEGDDGAATINENNTTLTLQENLRYRFINNGGQTAHPFGFQDAAEAYLLAQGDRVGSFEEEDGVDFESDNEGISFTLTSALAAEINSYNCQIHASMEGSVSTQ